MYSDPLDAASFHSLLISLQVAQSVPLAILSAVMDSVFLVPMSATWMTIAGMVVMRFIVIAVSRK